jgi:hypothetical protein
MARFSAGLALLASAAAFSPCTFCALNPSGVAVNFDLSTLPTSTWTIAGYTVTTPCGQSDAPVCGPQNMSMTQSCKGLGSLANTTLVLTPAGFNVTLHGGFDDPPMANGRNAVYAFVCDNTVPASNPPIMNVTESPGGFYNVVWRTPAACPVVGGSACGPPPPVPPPVAPPAPCAPGAETCLPKWTPTWGMRNSTVLYTCNNSGMHSVEAANAYGVVVYDWCVQSARATSAAIMPISDPTSFQTGATPRRCGRTRTR